MNRTGGLVMEKGLWGGGGIVLEPHQNRWPNKIYIVHAFTIDLSKKNHYTKKYRTVLEISTKNHCRKTGSPKPVSNETGHHIFDSQPT